MRCIVIDAQAQTVLDTEISNGDLDQLADLQKIVGGSIGLATRIGEDVLYVNDNGLLLPMPQHFFQLKGFVQPLAGNGIVTGMTRTGNTRSPKTPIGKVRRMVTFLGPKIADLKKPLWKVKLTPLGIVGGSELISLGARKGKGKFTPLGEDNATG